MARWMVEKGAKNIVLVSRSGSATGKVKELIEDMAAIGAKIIVQRCDVTDADAVKKLVTKELVGLPPVRGVVHGTMVLHVSRPSSPPYTLLTPPGRSIREDDLRTIQHRHRR